MADGEEEGRKIKLEQNGYFSMGLLDYILNLERTSRLVLQEINKTTIVWITLGGLFSILEACASIPYVWDAILKQCHPYIHSTTVLCDRKQRFYFYIVRWK